MNIQYSSLSRHAVIIMGQSPPGETYNDSGVGIPLLNGPTEFGTIHPIAKQWTTSPTKLCRAGDILFCVRGATAGRINIADKEYCLGRGLAAIRVQEDRFDGRFLHHILAAGYATFQARGVGSTFINISSEHLAKFPIPLFSLSEQRRVAAILDQVVDLKHMREEAMLRLSNLGSAIYTEMFGDWRFDEPKWPLVPVGSKLEFLTSG